MAVNADPKPGRWILPLVVLGMVAFTYFFVRALPSGSEEGSPDTTLGATETTLGEEGPGDTTSDTTVPETPTLDPATQAYLDGVGAILTGAEELQREMAAVNAGFDADPRTVEFSDAVDRLTALAEQADTLVEELDGLTVPEPLTSSHETIRQAMTTAAAAAEEALEGLQSDDDGSRRRDAVTAFDTAVADLQTAIGNARSAAGLSATPTTEAPPDTTSDTTTETTAAPTDTTEGGEGDA